MTVERFLNDMFHGYVTEEHVHAWNAALHRFCDELCFKDMTVILECEATVLLTETVRVTRLVERHRWVTWTLCRALFEHRCDHMCTYEVYRDRLCMDSVKCRNAVVACIVSRHPPFAQFTTANHTLAEFFDWCGVGSIDEFQALGNEEQILRWQQWPGLWVSPCSTIGHAGTALAAAAGADRAPYVIYTTNWYSVQKQSVPVWLRNRLPPTCTREQRLLIQQIIDLFPSDATNVETLRAALELTPFLPTETEFASLDVHELRVLVGDTKGAMKLLTVAKKQSKFDPDGQFASHLCRVGRSTMDQNPALWLYPVDLAVAFEHKLEDQHDRAHFLELAEAIALPRIQDLPRRLPARTRAAVSCSICKIIRVARDLYPVPRDLFPKGMDRARLIEAVSIMSARNWWYAAKLSRPHSEGYEKCELVDMINGAISRGVFEPNVSRKDPVKRTELYQATRRLALDRPMDFVCEYQTGNYRSECHITDDDLEKMVVVVNREPLKTQAVYWLLYTLALRIKAIESLRFEDVWDNKTGNVRYKCKALEKFSEVRCCHLCPIVREKVKGFIEQEYNSRCVYLFGRPENPQLTPKHLVYSMLHDICRKAGIKPQR